MSRSTRSTRTDRPERALPERVLPKYADVSYAESEVRFQQFRSVADHYRTTLADAGLVTDDSVIGIGLVGDDLNCAHTVTSLDRFGYGRCSTCEGHLWSMAWVADGLYGMMPADGASLAEVTDETEFVDETVQWAEATLARHLERLPKLRLL